MLKIHFVSADDDECALKTDTCSILGPDWICRNTLGSFRCDKKRCTGPNCRVHQGGFNNTNQSNQSTVKCLRGYETNQNNKCIGIIIVIIIIYYLIIYFRLNVCILYGRGGGNPVWTNCIETHTIVCLDHICLLYEANKSFFFQLFTRPMNSVS